MPSSRVYQQRYRKAADHCVVKLVSEEALCIPVSIDFHCSETLTCGNHLAKCPAICDLIEDGWVSR